MKKNIAAIIILLVVAVVSFLAGGRYRKDQSATDLKNGRKVLYYVDPMTPGFRSDKPGVAPCGMPLEPVYQAVDEQEHTASGAVKISPERQQLIGVKIATAEKKPMTYTLRLYGRVVPDETRIYRINSSTDCWIRELSDVVTGSIVKKDQILAEALAPAYYNAQVTYLIALDNIDRIRQQLGGDLRHQQGDLANNQIRVAVQALQNLGITDAQTKELANTRQARPYLQIRAPSRGVVLDRKVTLNQWFKAAEEFYTIADIGKVWVYADVYEDEAIHLRPGMDTEVWHTQMGKTFNAKVSKVLPLFDPVSKTLKVRIDVDNPDYDLRPDMFVDVKIPITKQPSLNVPAGAVIDSGTKTIIYVDTGNGTFEPREVKTGWRLAMHVEIIAGLMPGEKFVVSGNFLIDSESRMKTAVSGAEVITSKDPVCGMDIDEKKAEISGRIASCEGRTLYFCTEECKKLFEKDPQKYLPDKRASSKKENNVAIQGTDHGWADLIEPVKVSRKNRIKDKHGEAAGSEGIVDWDGNAPAGDWSKWGEFPGAKYLGQKHKK